MSAALFFIWKSVFHDLLDPFPNGPDQVQTGVVQAMVRVQEHFFVMAFGGQGFQLSPQGFNHPVGRRHRIPAAADEQQVPVLEPVGTGYEAPFAGVLDAVLPQVFKAPYVEHVATAMYP